MEFQIEAIELGTFEIPVVGGVSVFQLVPLVPFTLRSTEFVFSSQSDGIQAR